MKSLGLIGGIGWESTAVYYRLINQDVRNRRGSLYSANLVLVNVDFNLLADLARQHRWAEAGRILAEAATRLQQAGADGVVLCSALMHYVARYIEHAIEIPLIHIGDAIRDELRLARIKSVRVGFLGARFTLEQGFLFDRQPKWTRAKRLQPLIPSGLEMTRLDHIIYDELCRGLIREKSGEELRAMIKALRGRGAASVVLASSELSILLEASDFTRGIFDGTEIHAAHAVRWALDELHPVIKCRRRPVPKQLAPVAVSR